MIMKKGDGEGGAWVKKWVKKWVEKWVETGRTGARGARGRG